MDTARLFQSGRSQAVRLPKDHRFRGSEVAVKHSGNGVLLLQIDDPWQTLEDGLAAFRHQPLVGLEGLSLLWTPLPPRQAPSDVYDCAKLYTSSRG